MVHLLRPVVGALLSLALLTPCAHARTMTIGIHTGPTLPMRSALRARYDQGLPFGTLNDDGLYFIWAATPRFQSLVLARRIS